jgi:hypothetical protein
VHNRRAEGALTEDERDIRTDILAGLIADKRRRAPNRHRILAEIISSDVALLVTLIWPKCLAGIRNEVALTYL